MPFQKPNSNIKEIQYNTGSPIFMMKISKRWRKDNFYTEGIIKHPVKQGQKREFSAIITNAFLKSKLKYTTINIIQWHFYDEVI